MADGRVHSGGPRSGEAPPHPETARPRALRSKDVHQGVHCYRRIGTRISGPVLSRRAEQAKYRRTTARSRSSTAGRGRDDASRGRPRQRKETQARGNSCRQPVEQTTLEPRRMGSLWGRRRTAQYEVARQASRRLLGGQAEVLAGRGS